MQEPDIRYAVALEIEEPKLDGERRFLVLEREYIERQMVKTAGESWSTWRPVTVSGLGVYRRQDWERYKRTLAHYEHELDRYEAELAGGLVPFKIYVSNLGRDADTNIEI